MGDSAARLRPGGGSNPKKKRLRRRRFPEKCREPSEPFVTAREPSTAILGLIPARWGSSRFPGKPLHPIAGRPLLQHVWERCRACRGLSLVAVATDDERIRRAVEAFGGRVVMTSPRHPSGTDRIAEAAASLARAGEPCTHVINIQGDEPLIDPALIDALASRLRDDPDLEMITAANPIADSREIGDPNVVKVVVDRLGNALYFSRASIPHCRDGALPLGDGAPPVFRHKGIYGFRRDFLERFVAWPPSGLERTEQLEQLRALENGARIAVVLTDDRSIGVDTPEQVAIVEQQLAAQHA